MSLPIVIEVKPTWRDFLSLHFHVAFTREMRWIFCVLLIVVLVQPLCALYLKWPLGPYFKANAGSLLVLPAGMAAYVLLIYVAARVRWNSAAEVREPRRYEFSEWGIKIEAESTSGTMAWKNIRAAQGHKGFIVLRTFQRAFVFIPCLHLDEKTCSLPLKNLSTVT